MEKLRNLGPLCRQHYEKIILSAALLLLAGAVVYLFIESKAQSEVIRTGPGDYEKKKVKAVAPVDMTMFLGVLKRAEKPVGLDFSGPHNLFNPVKWQMNRGSSQIIKVVADDQVGVKAMRLGRIQPVNLSIAYSQSSSSGTGAELVVNGYWIYATNDLAAVARLRLSRLFMSLNATNKDAPFILRDVKGPAQEPEEFAAEFKESGEKFTFAPARPYFKVVGYEAELRYPASTNSTGLVRKGGSIEIEAQTYKIVDITPSEVVLSDDSNDKRYSVSRTVAR